MRYSEDSDFRSPEILLVSRDSNKNPKISKLLIPKIRKDYDELTENVH